MKPISILLLVTISSVVVPAKGSVLREVEFAQRVIVGELMRANADPSQSQQLGCQSAVELGISLLGIGGEKTGSGMLSLLALRLDGAASQEFHCQIAKRGKSFVRALEKYNSHDGALWCKAVFDSIRNRELRDLAGLRVVDVCRPEEEIERRRVQIIHDLNAGGTCEE